MFNKKSKMIIGCLAFLLALSVGYALFSDTINVTGKATAKASLDVTATCTKGFNSELTGSNVQGEGLDSFGFNEEYGYSNESCSVSGNTVNINVSLDYPGATRYYTVKFTNNGTIPAQIGMQEDNVEGNDIRNKSILNKVDASGEVVSSSSMDGIAVNSSIIMDYLPGVLFLGYSTPSGNLYVDDLSEGFYDPNDNILVYPGCSLYAIISAPWNIDDDNNFAKTGTYLEYDLSFEFNFSQPSNDTIELWDSVIDQM